MTEPFILADRSEGILTITLNRPEKLNAFNTAMGDMIADHILEANRDDETRVIILTGAGRAFCAGLDMSSGASTFTDSDATRGSLSGPARQGARMIESMYNSTKPIIAAVNGAAVGVGATLVLAADIRLAGKSTRFGFVFARRGLVIEAGGAWYLPRLVGLSKAMEWSFAGRMVGADEAHRERLVSEVVADEQLLDRARELAREIAVETAPVAVAITRQLFLRCLGDRDPFTAMQIDSRLMRDIGPGQDVVEGMTAFLEKRKPKFPGRVSQDMPSGYPWWKEDGWSTDVYGQ